MKGERFERRTHWKENGLEGECVGRRTHWKENALIGRRPDGKEKATWP